MPGVRGALGAGCVVLVLLGGACGAARPAVSAGRLLAEADTALNATNSLHFVITSMNAGGGSAVTGGEGDLVRPSGLVGSFDVSLSGLPVTIRVKAAGTKFYVEVPFTSSYISTSPSKYDIANPAQFLSRTDGLSKILTVAVGARAAGTTRLSGELLDDVAATVPGADVPVIQDLAPAQPVHMVAAIDPSSHQLRQVTLTGPFVSANANATYVVTLTNYGEPVNVTLPSS